MRSSAELVVLLRDVAELRDVVGADWPALDERLDRLAHDWPFRRTSHHGLDAALGATCDGAPKRGVLARKLSKLVFC